MKRISESDTGQEEKAEGRERSERSDESGDSEEKRKARRLRLGRWSGGESRKVRENGRGKRRFRKVRTRTETEAKR